MQEGSVLVQGLLRCRNDDIALARLVLSIGKQLSWIASQIGFVESATQHATQIVDPADP